MLAYRHAHLDGEEGVRWSKPKPDPGTAIDFLREAFDAEERLRWRLRGEPWSGWRTRATVVDRLRTRLKDAEVGDLYVVEDRRGSRIGIRVVERFPAADTPGTPAVDRAHRAALTEFGDRLESWGICSCRRIAGSTSWSQHAYCNAEDWHGTRTVMAALARFLVAHAGELDVAHVIWDGRIWDHGSRVWRTYGGSNPHRDHVHVDFLPVRTGVPPCAR